MIDVKGAVARATQYLKDVFPSARNIELEEVEVSEPNQDWYVTLSFLRDAGPRTKGSVMEELMGRKYERVYKQVTVDGKSGECRSIKIRQLQ